MTYTGDNPFIAGSGISEDVPGNTDNPESATNTGINHAVTELAKLSDIEYEACRKEKANQYGVRVSVLDTSVRGARKTMQALSESSVVEDTQPAIEYVNGDELLDELAELLTRHVYLPKGAAYAVAVWCLGTFCMDAFSLWPKCLITSPEKRCGKTTLIDTMEALTFKALVVSNISPSAIFRSIDEWHPTLFIDEADTFIKDNPELNGIINAGHKKRTANIVRSEKVGEIFKPKKFSVWSPMVVAGIGAQRETLHDRSIHIEMERKLPDEAVLKLPQNFFEQCLKVREKCLRWYNDNQEALRIAYIEIPNYGNDRAQDNWHPLCVIAQTAGGEWLNHVKASYKLFELSPERDEDAGILLLRDIQQILKDGSHFKIASSLLVDNLIKIEGTPWAEWRRGQPMTQNSLSRLLKPFKIKPKTIRINGKTPRGFEAKQFENVFKRYIPPIQSATVQQTSCDAGYSGFQSATRNENVALSNSLKPSCDAECCTVALQKGEVETTV